jgi:hypothetical protein
VVDYELVGRGEWLSVAPPGLRWVGGWTQGLHPGLHLCRPFGASGGMQGVGILSRAGCFFALHLLNAMGGGKGDRFWGAGGGFGGEFVLLGEELGA